MYKDKEKQREADRERQKRRRDKIKAESVTESRCDRQGVTDMKTIFNAGEQSRRLGSDEELRRTYENSVLCVPIEKPERTERGNIRVSKPGDSDYVPQCETTRAFIEGRDKKPEAGKRGKDIKCFEDLPPDVQQTIDSLSVVDGKIDQTIKVNRTAIAIHYQHLFPDRYHSTGAAL